MFYRSEASAKLLGLPAIRYTYECVAACRRGTNDPREYEQHLARCRFIFPAVMAEIAKRLGRGEQIALPPRPPARDRVGQLTIPDLPAAAPRQRKR